MKTRIQKWGNSLALRIPKALAQEVNLDLNTPVDVSLVEGGLVIKPVQQSTITLDELLAGITPQNRHQETDWGQPRGREIW